VPSFQNPVIGNNPVLLLQPGVPGYAFGSKNPLQPTTLLQITRVALTSNVATVTVLVREGNIPAVGSLITIQGTQTASGAFNVTNVAITGVTITASTGVGTITFALTHADVASTADAGQGYVPVPEVGEALTGSVQTSQAFAIPQAENKGDQQTVIRWQTTFPSAPASAAVQLEVSEVYDDSQFVAILTMTQAGGLQEISNIRARFVRVKVTASSGGSSPTIVSKILV
jgi:hypothetical protein